MTGMSRYPLTADTKFANSVRLAKGAAFEGVYCLELFVAAPAKIAINLIPEGTTVAVHTVMFETVKPVWLVTHFLVGSFAFKQYMPGTKYMVELQNLAPGTTVQIAQGQLTYASTLEASRASFASGLCTGDMTPMMCLSALKAEVDATKSWAATLPYLNEWDTQLARHFGRSSIEWSEGAAEEQRKVLAEAMSAALDEVEKTLGEELLEKMKLAELAKELEAELKAWLRHRSARLVVWIERLAKFSAVYDVLDVLFTPSRIATDHQEAVLAGQVCLDAVAERLLAAEFPRTYDAVRRVDLAPPGPVIGPKP